MTFIGQPAKLLVLAGSLNGLILPVTLGTILLASRRKDIVGEYKHPIWLLVFGIIVVILTAYGGWVSLQNIKNLKIKTHLIALLKHNLFLKSFIF